MGYTPLWMQQQQLRDGGGDPNDTFDPDWDPNKYVGTGPAWTPEGEQEGQIPGLGRPTTGPDLSYNIIGQRPVDLVNHEQMPRIMDDTPTIKDFDPNQSVGNMDWSWLEKLVGQAGTTIQDYFKNPAAFPAIATAIQQWNNASQYGDDREAYRKEGNPFGEYRPMYAQKLNDLYNDPSSIANNPAYQFRLSQGMGTLGGQQSALHGGYGNEFAAMQKYAQGLASTEYDNEIKRLMQLSGANFGPEASLNAQVRARDQQVAAQNGALQALATPFGQNVGDQRNGTSTVPNIKLPDGSSIDWGKLVAAAGKGDSQAVWQISQLAQQGSKAAIEWLTKASGGAGTDENLANLGPGGTTIDDPSPEYEGPDSSYFTPPEYEGPPSELFTPPDVDYGGEGFDSFFG